jgi:hypothetical protein
MVRMRDPLVDMMDMMLDVIDVMDVMQKKDFGWNLQVLNGGGFV